MVLPKRVRQAFLSRSRRIVALLLVAAAGIAVALALHRFGTARGAASPKQTDLHTAAWEGNVAEVRRLLSAGADPNERKPTCGGMTPLHLATLAKQQAVVDLLRAHGADDSIRDDFGLTPRQAAAIRDESHTRPLLPASSYGTLFDPNAIVLIAFLAHRDQDLMVRSLRIGFVIDGGAVVVTADHCVEDFRNPGEQPIMVRPLVISRYYGDIFEAGIVASSAGDKDDLALLRVPWHGHPGLSLASEKQLAEGADLICAAYVPPEDHQSDKNHLSRELLTERLPLSRLDPAAGCKAVTMAGARFAGPGWSGSPMILTGDGAVAGVLSSQSKPNIGETLLFTQIHGPDVRRLLALCAGVPKPADPPGMAPRRPAHAEEAFRTTLDCWESLMKTELSHASDLARQLVDKRPESMGAHLLLASIELQREKRAADGELMRSSLKKATKIAPTSFLAHAVHGHVLVRMERYKEAVAELEQAASLDPGNVLVRLDQMKALRRTDPSAAESLGRQLVRDASENVSYRVELVESLRVRGKHAEVVKEAREGLKRRPDDLHLLALMGDALEQTGALDEAETCFKRIAEGHSCSKCWFRYARFLVEHRPNRRSEAAKMLDKVESLNSSQVVSAKDIAECRARLAGTTKPAD